MVVSATVTLQGGFTEVAAAVVVVKVVIPRVPAVGSEAPLPEEEDQVEDRVREMPPLLLLLPRGPNPLPTRVMMPVPLVGRRGGEEDTLEMTGGE
jgi:hypothetical protein